MAEKESQAVQALSVGGQPTENPDDQANKHVRMLEMHLNDAKRERAGIEPEPSNEMP